MPRPVRRLFVLLAAFLAAFPQLRAADTEATSINLAGEWRFALDRSTEQTVPQKPGREMPLLSPGDGLTQEWFKRNLPDKIQLPGILQAQGYGDDIRTNTPWVLGLGDAWWNLQPAALRAHFSQPGHVEVPFLSQPPRHYLGAAWYQRDMEIPTSWKGRHFTLFLERAHWQSRVWVDNREFPANDSLGAPHVTDLGTLAPGKHRLTIRVDNRTQLPAQGHLIDSHSISDSLGAAWNGIVGKIELRSTPPVWIEDVQIFPDASNNSILAQVRIGNLTGKSGSGTIWFGCGTAPSAEVETIEELSAMSHKAVNWDTNGTALNLEISLTNFPSRWLKWDEFHPNLRMLYLELKGHAIDDYHNTVFGFREISTSGKDLIINGRSINLRLTHDGGEFPFTGYPAMDAESWKKIIQTCKNYGLNGIRFHSWCPPEAAFEAADEMGFYLQPECSLWADFGSPEMQQWLNDETARLLATYGNHPSFILLSPSNEPRNFSRFTPPWAATNHVKDNRRLYSAGTGWSDPSQVNGGAQYATLVAMNRSPLRNTSGWFGHDYRTALETVHIPVLSHEVGQWCAYPDFDVIQEFTGYLRPGNYEIFKDIAQQEGVLDQDHIFAWASGRFQVAAYKEEIEANLRTPGLAGLQLLDLHDYLGQGTAFIGVVDAFWHPKNYVTGAEFSRFAGPSVPLARLTNRVFTSNQSLDANVEMYHFGEAPLIGAVPYWKIVNAAGETLAGGQWGARDIPIGKNIPLGQVTADLSKFAAPVACKLVVGLRGTPIENDWNFWVYPAQVGTNTPPEVLITRSWDEARTRLAAGGKVLFLPNYASLDPTKCPPMKNVPIFWNIQMTVRPPQNPSPRFDAMLGLVCDTNHPALAAFPTEVNCDWQWTRLVDNVRSINLGSAPRQLRPIVEAIDDWNRNWRLGVIFECNVGPGRLLVSAINLDGDQGGSELLQLRRSLLDYMAGSRFQPAVTLTPEQAGSLWTVDHTAPAASPARRFDPDLNDGSVPAPPPKSP